MKRAEIPQWFEQRERDADDEKIVGIGEKSHPRNEHDLPMKRGDPRIVEVLEAAGKLDNIRCHTTVLALREHWVRLTLE